MASSAIATRVVVSITYAKAHFHELLERAHAGEEIVISYRDKPYAWLVPLEQEAREPVSVVLARIRERAREMGLNATADEIVAWKHEGHRY